MGSDEKIAYLGEKKEEEINGQKFEYRGITLGEALEFSKALAKIVVNFLKTTTPDNDLIPEAIGSLVGDSEKDIYKLEELVCRVIDKPKGFLIAQDPSYLFVLLARILESTKFEVVKENFFKIGKNLGMENLLKGLVPSLASSENSPQTKDGQ